MHASVCLLQPSGYIPLTIAFALYRSSKTNIDIARIQKFERKEELLQSWAQLELVWLSNSKNQLVVSSSCLVRRSYVNTHLKNGSH